MKRKILDILHLTLIVVIWLTPVVTYFVSIGLMIKLFWMPIFALYGFWSTIGMMLGLTLTAWLSATLFFWFSSKVRTPMATYKENF